jgi:BT1 family
MAWYDFVKNSWERFKTMYDVMGKRFVILIVLVEHLLQAFVYGGGTYGFIGIPIVFLLRQLGLPAPRIQILKAVAVSPWALKPLFGMVSDTIYIGGYRRMPYILFSLLPAIVACVIVAIAWPLEEVAATSLFFLMFLPIAVADLLIEAAYIRKVHAHPSVAPDLVSFVDVGSSIVLMASIGIMGVLLTYTTEWQYIYLAPIIPFIITVWPVYDNWLGERPYKRHTQLWGDVPTEEAEDENSASDAETSHLDNRLINLLPCSKFCVYANEGVDEYEWEPVFGFDVALVRRHWRMFVLSCIVVIISLVTSTIGLATTNTTVLFVFSVLSAPVMIACFALLTDARTAKLQTFVLLQNMFSVSIGAADFFFLTDTVEQYPQGPHFSNFFVVTVMGLAAAALSVLGGVTYNMFMTGWSYRSVLVFANVSNIFFSLLNVAFCLRWNLLIGMPDWLFVLGGEALQVVTGAWASLPFKVMMLQLCPPDAAATAYAMLAGSTNLGTSLSQYQGAFLLDQLGVRPTGATGEGAQFDNLWIAVLINALLPIVPLFMIYVLIPDKPQTSSLMEKSQPLPEEEEVGNEEEMLVDLSYMDEEIELEEMNVEEI